MTLIRRSNPFGELVSLRHAMDRLFEDSFVSPRMGNVTEEQHLALDVYTTPDALVVEAALPGVKPDDVNISVLGDTLTISGSTQDELKRDEGGYSYREIRRGSFNRTLSLPGGIKTDAATANFENGLLRLSFPKAEEAKPRQIQIKASPTTEGKATSASGQPQSVGGGQSTEQTGS
jgi:HSP20 family protein